jgi:RNA polymerase sigma-70 factor, ECF subfamily
MNFIIPFKRKDSKTDDQLLSEFVNNGNSESLGELYSRYMHLVYGVCLKYFKDQESSKDAVIFIFEKIYCELSKHEVKNFKSWLHVVTKNYCLMEIRKKKTIGFQIAIDDIRNEKFMENGYEMHPIDSVLDIHLENSLNECIKKLKEEQRNCIILFYTHNKCYREIAIKMNINENKVKSYIQNGKRNLKICLGKNK